MPGSRFVTALAAGAVNANILAGSQFEFLGSPSRVQIYGIDDTAGAGGVAEMEVFFGQELQLTQSPMNLKAAGPEVPEDLLVDDVGAAGDRITIRIAETGGALAAIANTLVKITPAPMR